MAIEEVAAVGPRGDASWEADFARRCDAHLGRAYRLACYLMGDLHDAEDATQEAMARAWKARRSLRQLEAFDGWMDRIVVNTCRERLRHRRRRPTAPLDETDSVAADRLEGLMARDSIGRALGTLNADQRAVVVLRYWRDLPLDQIAERLGWPLGTVKSLLHSALASMKVRLERDESEVER